ncbi:hypothetical protein AB0C48_29715, partial [Streptomyces sp. NPDC048556]|uniref:hypothetical protein n=1 Tax=Streptomyces sp. NPDC048556 TaxID=3156664 RepID=UPI0034451538
MGEEAVTAQSDLVTGPLLRQEKAGINEFPTTFPGPFLDLIVNAPAKTVSYVGLARWARHGAGYVELDCSGRAVGDRG